MNERLDFIFGVIKDNYQEHIPQIIFAIGVPFVADYIEQFSPWLIIMSAWLLYTSWMSMLRQDMADHYRSHIFSIELAMSEMLQERFENVLKEKLDAADADGIREINIDFHEDENGINVK